jgi:hypothetical protein
VADLIPFPLSQVSHKHAAHLAKPETGLKMGIGCAHHKSSWKPMMNGGLPDTTLQRLFKTPKQLLCQEATTFQSHAKYLKIQWFAGST